MATSLMRNLGDDAIDAPQDEFAENQRHIDEYNQAQQQEQRGAPADFGGPVIPNPKGIRPMADTEVPPPEEHLTGNAKMNTENAPMGQPPMRMNNTPGQDIKPTEASAMASPQSSAMKPLGEQEQATAGAEQPPQEPKKEVHPDTKAIIGAQRTMLTKEATDKAAKGDLLGAGNAKIAMNQLMEHVDTDPFKEKEPDPYMQGGGPMRPEPNMAAPETNAVSAPNPADVAPNTAMVPLGQEPFGQMPTYTGTQRIGKGTPGEAELHNDLETQRGHLRNIIATGDETQAAQARLQLARLNEMNPYGSPANHPGALGKIEHGLAKAGNIAGSVLAPEVMAGIPGTDLNKQLQENRAQGELKNAAGHDLTVAETAKASAEAEKAKNPLIEKTKFQQVKGPDDKPLMHNGMPVGVNEDGALAVMTPQGPVIMGGQQQPQTAPTTAEPAAPGTPPAEGKGGFFDQPKVEPKTKADREDDYAGLRTRNDKGEQLTADEQSRLHKYTTEFSVGEKGAKEANAQIDDLLSSNPKTHGVDRSHYLVKPADTDTEAKAKLAAAKDVVSSGQVQQHIDVNVNKDEKTNEDQQARYSVIQTGINGLAKPDILKMYDNAGVRAALANAEAEEVKQVGAYVPGVGGFSLPAGTLDQLVTQKAIAATDAYKLVNAYNNAAESALQYLMITQGGKVGRGGQIPMSKLLSLLPGGKTTSSADAKDKLERFQDQVDIWKKTHNIQNVQSYRDQGYGTAGAPSTSFSDWKKQQTQAPQQ